MANPDRPDPPRELFGSRARFHHVGLVVRSIEAVAPSGIEIFDDPIQRVRVAFVDVHGVRIEYIEPATDDSPVRGNLRTGNLLAHLCYEVQDMAEALAAGRTSGFRVVAEPVPAVAFDGRSIAWMYSPIYGLAELLETA